jgi:hypothetical protein
VDLVFDDAVLVDDRLRLDDELARFEPDERLREDGLRRRPLLDPLVDERRRCPL